MAEIKSTLDLIMEKTKNLTMTDEEKKAVHSQELRKKIKGWVQRCIDGTMNIAHLKENVQQEMKKEPGLPADLLEELLKKIDPEGANEVQFEIIESVLQRDTAPLKELIEQFRVELAEKVRERTDKEKKALEGRNISGSAIVPNLDRDPQWKSDRKQLKESYVKRIRFATAS
jgi:hypothetical protein